MEEEPWTSSTLIPRVTYDLLFFAFLNVIFFNIMFGIIIDNFGELRDDIREREMDMMSTCFICGLDADTLERIRVGGFRTYVKREHNMWMYLYFMHYLWQKDPDEFTGQESYVQEKIYQNDLTFFPEGGCLSLQEEENRRNAKNAPQDTTDASDENSTVWMGNDGALPGEVGTGGMAEGHALALSLKELVDLKEAFGSILQEVTADVQKVKALIQDLEITNRSMRCDSASRSVTGTLFRRGGFSQLQKQQRTEE